LLDSTTFTDHEPQRRGNAEMHELNQLSEKIIGLAIEVHRHLGPGLSEAAYERALCMELDQAGLSYRKQIGVPVIYKGEVIAEHRPDLVVADLIVVEVKAVERLAPVHTSQMITYLQITGLELGLILNFNEPVLRAGIKRVVLQRGVKTL
jgi:GxxExxY protein